MNFARRSTIYTRHAQRALTVLFTAALLVACNGGAAELAPTPAPVAEAAPPAGSSAAAASTGSSAADPVAAEDSGVNILVVADGNVILKRRTWGDYFSAEFGAELRRGDLIRVTGEGGALVLCDGLTTWEVSPGAPAGLNNGCPPPPESILVRGESLVGNTRSAVDPLIPYIISPRKTKVLSRTPLLRWNPVEGATTYSVSIRGSGVEWSTTTTETSLVYPGEPPLAPGGTYALLVEADSGTASRDEGAPGLGFTVVDEAAASAIDETLSRLDGLALGDEAEVVAVAQFYTGQGLLAEAIEALDALAQADIASPNIYRLLGDLYRQIGLAQLAGPYYEAAVAKAEATQDVEARAASQVGLAEVHVSLGDQEAAVAALNAAKTDFVTLGDGERIAEVEARIVALGG